MNKNNYAIIVGELVTAGMSCVLNGNHALLIKVKVDNDDTFLLHVPTPNHYLFKECRGMKFKFICHMENKHGQKLVVDDYSKIDE